MATRPTSTRPAGGSANVIPGRYRQVAVAEVPSLTVEDLVSYFTGREVYFRTRFIVARAGDRLALVEVDRDDAAGGEAIFVPTTAARVVAGPEECALVTDPALDCAVPSQLALAAERAPGKRCVVVEGAYSHISFILDPAPLRIRLVDVVPPEPAKLLDQVTRVLAMAEDLPPVVVDAELHDTRDLLADERPEQPADLLIACRASGMEFGESRVWFLDERPAEQPWTLLGCERSDQIHQWFYDSVPDRVDTCPRRWLDDHPGTGATLTRCCLLQEGVESGPRSVQVPWGASLAEVRLALEELARTAEVPWTPI